MKIVFWSNGKGKNGVTSNMIATSFMAAMQYQYKIVMLQARFDINSLDYAFLERNQDQVFRECGPYASRRGIDYFLKRNRRNVKEDSPLYQGMEKLLEEIYYIPGTSYASREVFEESMLLCMDEILDRVYQVADMIFVDAGSGMSKLSKKILDDSDLLVVNTVHETGELEQFFWHYPEYVKKSVYLISFYNSNSTYNLKKIQRIYWLEEKQIAAVPYSASFQNAVCSGKTVPYLTNNYRCRASDQNYFFMKEIKAASNIILQRTGLLK